MLTELSKERPRFRYAQRQDDTQIQKWINPQSFSFSFQDWQDDPSYVALVEEEFSTNFQKRFLQSFMLAKKTTRSSAEILLYVKHNPQQEDPVRFKSFMITMMEQLFQDGFTKIQYGLNAKLYAHSHPSMISVLFDFGFSDPLWEKKMHVDNSSVSNSSVSNSFAHYSLPTSFFSLREFIHISKKLLICFPLELIHVITSYLFFPEHTCRVVSGDFGKNCWTPDQIFVVQKCLGWWDQTMKKTLHLVRYYVHPNAEHFDSLPSSYDGFVSFLPTSYCELRLLCIHS